MILYKNSTCLRNKQNAYFAMLYVYIYIFLCVYYIYIYTKGIVSIRSYSVQFGFWKEAIINLFKFTQKVIFGIILYQTEINRKIVDII